jgi:hypothetical protein
MPPPTIADEYRYFATREAHGSSPLYERLALGVAGDGDLIALLADLPPAKRQPNLFFAAARYVAGTPAGYPEFRRSVLEHRNAVMATMRARRTQTNEPARCAALYPLLASLPQPLALLEVGASAGLLLQPDRYGYDYNGDYNGDYDGHPAGAPDSPLRLPCRTEGRSPFGAPGPLRVAWRGGIDLNPLDVTDPDDMRWLRTLIWPEHRDRLRRLDAAIALARTDPPRVVRGDLNERLDELIAAAPPDATLVVYHSAVLWYVPEADRAAFTERVVHRPGHWISQEVPGVLPEVDARLRESPPDDALTYTVALDRRPVAFSAVHGGWLRWLSG